MTEDQAVMGQYIREYESQPYNGNSLINGAIELFHPVRWAFEQGAVIVQEELFADCSFYQLEPYWDLYRTKARAVVIRAGQGSWEDVQFRRNWSEAKRVGVARGTYWFYDGRVSPGEQANKLIALLKGDLPEMEIICDWERNYGGSFEGLRNVVAFMQAVEAGLPGITIGMYTGYYFFKENSNAIINTTQYQYLKSRPLWLGWYAAAVNVIIPAPWEKLTHWQWGTPNWGISWGMNTVELDVNFFNGSKVEFEQKYLDGASEPLTGAAMKGEVRTSFTLVIRDAENVLTGKKLYEGDVVYGTVNAGRITFARVYRKNGVVEPTAGNAAVKDPASPYAVWMTLSEQVEPVALVELPDLPVSITLGDDIAYAKQTVNVVLKPK